ncbi:MAG: hypothetical protein K2N48_00655 [Muribaculaceae bacterium]|nr:hypothetical protein [Muribaculaceae bacterium]
MTTDYKVTLRDIVEIFYQSPFKIFNINSVDGETMIKPLGYFISLGITTSLDSLRLIRDYIARSGYGFEAKISEIKSIKSSKYGDYLNILLPTPEDEITKYESVVQEDLELLGKSEATQLLSEITDEVRSGNFLRAPIKQKLLDCLSKIGDDWDSYQIQIKAGVPSVFHKFVNYKKTEDSEYRIGIYATKL